MHESGLIEDLIRKIEAAARANGGTKVTAVDLTIGAFASIEADHLREHFEVASAGTMAEGAELRIQVSEDPLGPDPQHITLQSVEIET
jgi:hydrogenase nickel incorporation protein HypA/HybF